MGIIKLEINVAELTEAITEIQKQRRKFFDILTGELRAAASSAITQLMNAEMTIFLGKSEQNKRNG